MGKVDGFVPDRQVGGGFKTAMKLASITTNPGSMRRISQQATSSALSGALSALNANRRSILHETGRVADKLTAKALTDSITTASNTITRKQKDLENLAEFAASRGVNGFCQGGKQRTVGE